MPHDPAPLAPLDPSAIEHTASPSLHPDVEALLAGEMARGFSVRLACARAGVDFGTVELAAREDAALAARLRTYRDRAVAALVERVIRKAETGHDPSIRFLLETSGDPAFVPHMKVTQVTEEDVESSPVFQRFVKQVMTTVCEECRARLKEAGGA